jgi:menaquinone-9 beta-reductase
MQNCEVLIVGGGPAGSSCAGRLIEAGRDVLVIDRKTFPRDKTCAGWVTPQVFEVLGVDPDDYARSHVCQPITGFRTGMIGGEEVGTDYGRVVSYGIRRCEFDHFLLERSGAPCRFGESVESLRRDGSGWIVNDAIRAEVLVGAGGHFCPVARALGGREGGQIVTVAAQEIEFELRPEDEARVNLRGEIPELYFCEDLAGYGWCFRKGNFLNVGLGRLNSPGVSAHVQSFCRFLRDRGKIACDLPERFHGHAYRIYERLEPKLVDDGALFIGDAAGLAYPQSGEGIRPAVESGLLAADVLIAAAGNYSLGRLSRYANEIYKRFGTPRRAAVSDWLPASFLRFAAARLMASRWFTRSVVLDRWFLHAADPVLPVGRPTAALSAP